MVTSSNPKERNGHFYRKIDPGFCVQDSEWGQTTRGLQRCIVNQGRIATCNAGRYDPYDTTR